MHAECNGANNGATEGEQAAARGLEDALIQTSHAKQQREPNCLLNDRMEWLCNVGVGSIGADLTLALQSRRHALRSAETEVCALTPRVAETRMQFSCTDPRRSWLNKECTHTSNDANRLNLCCHARASALPRLLSADSQTQRMQAAYPVCASLQCTSPPPLRFLGCPAACFLRESETRARPGHCQAGGRASRGPGRMGNPLPWGGGKADAQEEKAPWEADADESTRWRAEEPDVQEGERLELKWTVSTPGADVRSRAPLPARAAAPPPPLDALWSNGCRLSVLPAGRGGGQRRAVVGRHCVAPP